MSARAISKSSRIAVALLASVAVAAAAVATDALAARGGGGSGHGGGGGGFHGGGGGFHGGGGASTDSLLTASATVLRAMRLPLVMLFQDVHSAATLL